MVACLELSDVPGGASSDDLCLAAEQYAPVEQALLLSPGGTGSLCVALLWLQAGADLHAAAAALDGHPLAGSFLSAKVVEDPMQWVVRRVGSVQLLSRAAAPARSPPTPPQLAPTPAAAPPPPSAQPQYAPPRPGTALPRPAVPPAPSASAPAAPAAAAVQRSAGGTPASGAGVAAMEAELRELQAALQQSALEGSFQPAASAGEGWGSEEGEEGAEGWRDVHGKPARRGAGGANAGGAAAGTAGAAGDEHRIVVHNILPELTQKEVMDHFKPYGWMRLCSKKVGNTHALLSFEEPRAATAALQATNGHVVPALNPSAPLHSQWRYSSKGSGAKETSSAEPTTKLWIGNVMPEATLAAVERVFGRFGPVYACELRVAPESGRIDQWGFVNFRRVEDAKAALDALAWTPNELSTRLKLQYRPV
ncbi:heterogeneous nuclear ribonucleo A B isoform X2 [Micractinium conductrix]|uniref:Heterogeneous nuclear ribonucleo A B isoform X2 n=1 Tax=Micractinium conductrix TaxID=554055 RepID=A0A2P6V4Z2_9CHLO|nr:heterogeneous nuclear ribonucleo A B isoform X2 [Micractinium conductrix]|eukprot:PSC69160.1 heterogeneous nuclear ribonucleo A B isoform X2 [Micractinium conductrix]